MQTRVYVSGLVVDKAGKILILKRSESAKFAPGQWEFVNGSLKENEAAEETLKRELKEETTLDVEESKSLPIFEITDQDGRWVVIPFHVNAIGKVSLSTEHTEFRWVDVKDLDNIPYLSSEWQKIKKFLVEPR